MWYCEHINSCIVLRNMLLRNGGANDKYLEDDIEDERDIYEVGFYSEESLSDGERFRIQIKAVCLDRLGFLNRFLEQNVGN